MWAALIRASPDLARTASLNRHGFSAALMWLRLRLEGRGRGVVGGFVLVAQAATERELAGHTLDSVARARSSLLRHRQIEWETPGEGLVFGRLDDVGGTARRIGPIGISAETGDEPLVVDWRASTARPFYTSTAVHPQGQARRRHVRVRDGRGRRQPASSPSPQPRSWSAGLTRSGSATRRHSPHWPASARSTPAAADNSATASTATATAHSTRPLHTIAVTRERCHPATKDYIARRLDQGSTRREARRMVKRYLARHIYRHLEAAAAAQPAEPASTPGLAA